MHDYMKCIDSYINSYIHPLLLYTHTHTLTHAHIYVRMFVICMFLYT